MLCAGAWGPVPRVPRSVTLVIVRASYGCGSWPNSAAAFSPRLAGVGSATLYRADYGPLNPVTRDKVNPARRQLHRPGVGQELVRRPDAQIALGDRSRSRRIADREGEPVRLAAVRREDAAEYLKLRTLIAVLGAMVLRALDSAPPIAWVTADATYGQECGFRRMLEEAGVGYVLAVPSSSRSSRLRGVGASTRSTNRATALRARRAGSCQTRNSASGKERWRRGGTR
ncbi:hypothetical protein TNCT6_78450 [Streptomyces sp. 6-11-2]|nr:hypothetical protein TNCT6_78450 [Streptomyces sp. 6-11-2]